MSRRFKESVSFLRATVVLGVVGAACLTRPVVTSDPNLKTNFTNIINSTAVSKLDILFMIDNSSSMGDKQQLLALAVPDMINRLVSPNCIDNKSGATVGPSTNGNCPTGSGIEFPPVHDMHLGIVSSSLGGRGSTQCDPTLPNSAMTNLPSHNDDRGELINRGGATETPVPKASSNNFLAWFPPVTQNMQAGVVAPVNPETAVGDANTPGTLIGDFTQMISGVHEHGCGFEAQNESWYRFLIQPDPYDQIQVNSGNDQASFVNVDGTILAQRKAFLRDDSLVAVIEVTDETQEVANPLSVGRLGWLFEQVPWPNSTTGGAPEGSIECQQTPPGSNCQSCTVVPASQFATRCPNDGTGTQGYLDPSDDKINVRFFHQLQRFGVYAGYPTSRYVTGLTSPTVPDSKHEVDSNGNYIGDQSANQNCVNPLYATNLPTDPNGELCKLQRGTRTPDLVYFAVIGGVPHELLQAAPGDPECPAGTAAKDCPQKDTLSPADWLKITGNDPENYDFSGADPHMLESEGPRAQLSGCPPQASGAGDTCDPINGREWDTQKGDLQFACIFDLPAPKDCTQPQFNGACDCAATSASRNTPLCQADGNGGYTTTQIKGKAYPGILELTVAHQMALQPTGVQGIVSSLCPIHTTPQGGASDPVYGYRPAVNAIINRLKNALSVQCLQNKLTVDMTTGKVPCLVLMTLPQQGGEDKCNNSAQGLSVPAPDVLSRFQAGPHAAWLANPAGQPDPSSFPTCVLNEITASQFPQGASDCSQLQNQPGWCYIEGAGGGCAQQIIFTPGEPLPGGHVNLQCIEQANGATSGSSSGG